MKHTTSRLKQLRNKFSLSQPAVSKMTGIPLNRYRKLDNCQSVEILEKELTIKESQQLSNFFNMSVEELLYGN